MLENQFSRYLVDIDGNVNGTVVQVDQRLVEVAMRTDWNRTIVSIIKQLVVGKTLHVVELSIVKVRVCLESYKLITNFPMPKTLPKTYSAAMRSLSWAIFSTASFFQASMLVRLVLMSSIIWVTSICTIDECNCW